MTESNSALGKDLIGLEPLSKEQILTVLDTAEFFKDVSERRIKKVPVLRGKTIVNLFFEASTRTRVSFEVGMTQLGGTPLFLSADDLHLGSSETIEDTAEEGLRFSPFRSAGAGIQGRPTITRSPSPSRQSSSARVSPAKARAEPRCTLRVSWSSRLSVSARDT